MKLLMCHDVGDMLCINITNYNCKNVEQFEVQSYKYEKVEDIYD